MLDLSKMLLDYDANEIDLLSVEESWADFARALRTGTMVRTKLGTVTLQCGALGQVGNILGLHHDEFRAGNRAALIDALRVACEENVPLPYWLADGILAALSELDSNPAESLHSVFDMEARYPTSRKRSKKARQDWSTKRELYMRASQLIAQGVNKVEAIKQAIIGLPVQFRTAFKWYNEIDARQQKHLRAWRGVRLHKLR